MPCRNRRPTYNCFKTPLMKAVALIVHGKAIEVSSRDSTYATYSEYVHNLYVSMYGPKWAKWYQNNRENIEGGYHGWIEPRRMYAKK